MREHDFATRSRPFGFRCILFAAQLVVGSWVSLAHAMPTYPAEIQNHLQLGYTPQCTLCHSTPQGGGIPTTAFGKEMVRDGLTTNSSTLDPALDKMKADNWDSNGDGMTDIQALQDGIDPSTGVARSDAPTMKYGCGARIATSTVRSNAAVTLTLALLGMVLMSRRRTRF
jgi:hypothetical protein